jgi:hypothetical protein
VNEPFADLVQRIVVSSFCASAGHGCSATRALGQEGSETFEVCLDVDSDGPGGDEDGLRRDAEVGQGDRFSRGEISLPLR